MSTISQSIQADIFVEKVKREVIAPFFESSKITPFARDHGYEITAEFGPSEKRNFSNAVITQLFKDIHAYFETQSECLKRELQLDLEQIFKPVIETKLDEVCVIDPRRESEGYLSTFLCNWLYENIWGKNES